MRCYNLRVTKRQEHAETPEDLLKVLYQELRRVASIKLAGESPGQTLEPTALVHEAYLRLAKEGRSTPGETDVSSLPPRPKRCDGFSLKTLGVSQPQNGAAT